MTYIIAEPCIDIKDKSCVDVCPVDCIHEFGRMLVIDPEECIDCGACEPECPVEAIFPEDALPDKWEPFVKINYAFPEGAAVIDVGVNRVADPSAARGFRLVGDVDFATASQVAGLLTPVPGGVGPMTITMLLHNTLAAARLQQGT